MRATEKWHVVRWRTIQRRRELLFSFLVMPFYRASVAGSSSSLLFVSVRLSVSDHHHHYNQDATAHF